MVIVWQEQTGDWHQQEVRLSLHDNPRDACLSKNSLASFLCNPYFEIGTARYNPLTSTVDIWVQL